MSLKGKKVVILGGTSGIGLAAAKAFLDESAQIIIASRSASKLSDAKAMLGGNVEGYEIDFRNEEKVSDFFKQVGNFDHLIVKQ
ncbi:SDR family NAD(P)-dependent oxidoreductase [Paenibacillus lautus]|uniref:SDR family NAD(P)-dependent oxidoreductase n=1 Tax=Paenibacillus lautus TaxID=1401 RepID=UPI002FBEC742